ncbi:MAG: tripartite tricarboxylate transporter substrate binding protein [Pseudomonadota bacterium]
MIRTLTALVIAAGSLVAALPTGDAQAAEYPDKAVEFIVPWSPGGGSDTLMRIVSNNVEPHLGQPMPVINMPGVSGTVGLKEASGRDADGYTVAQIHEGLLTANASGITELSWDSFDPVALMVASPQYVVVNADRPYKTFEEFIAFAKENPGAIRFGVTLGGVPHLHAAMIEEAFEVEFSYVGYEGTGQRIRALVGGNLDAAIGDIASAGQFVENGDLVFLANGAPERVEQAPDVPTLTELGAPLELAVTRGIVMPKGASPEVKSGMEAALAALAEDTTFVTQVENAGGAVMFRGIDDYTAYLSNLSSTVERLAERLAP